MTTQTWSSVVDHTSDAGFRAWGSELAAKMALIGWVQTADTGQINWAFVTRPAVNVYAGYEIWRCANSSVYFKFEYGTAASASTPALRLSWGQGSNGAGTLTGTVSAALNVNVYTSAIGGGTVTTFPSYLSGSNNHLSLLWKVGTGNSGAANVPTLMFSWAKLVDTAGAYDATGSGIFYVSNTDSQARFYAQRLSAPAANYAATLYGQVVPGNLASSVDASGNFQIYNTWLSVPQMRPHIGAVVYRQTEILALATFVAAQVNGVNHTYLALGNTSAMNYASNAQTNLAPNPYCNAILFE